MSSTTRPVLPRIIARPVGLKGARSFTTDDGEVVTAKSNRPYTHASVYVIAKPDASDVKCGRDVGHRIIFLHARADLALKGSSDANRIAAHGSWARVPGIVTIETAE